MRERGREDDAGEMDGESEPEVRGEAALLLPLIMTDYAVPLLPSLPPGLCRHRRRRQLLFPQSNCERFASVGSVRPSVRPSKTATAPRILRSKRNGWNGRGYVVGER